MTGKVSLTPLSVGNIVSLAVQVWRSKLRTFFWIAVRAYLWFFPLFFGWFLIFYAAIFSSLAGGLPAEEIPPFVQAFAALGAGLWLLALILLPVALFGLAKYLTLSGGLARLAYQEISNQPESEKVALSHVNPKLWSYFRIAFLNGLILIGVYMGSLIVAGILIFVLAAIAGLLLGGSEVLAGLVAGLLTIVVILGVVVTPLVWVVVRLMIAEVPISVEPSVTATGSLGRSWELTQGSIGRLILVGFVAFILTIPIQFVVGYIPQIPISVMVATMDPSEPAFWVLQAISLLVSMITSVFVGAFLLPFWQTLKAVIYFDLRNRREGLGLNLSPTQG